MKPSLTLRRLTLLAALALAATACGGGSEPAAKVATTTTASSSPATSTAVESSGANATQATDAETTTDAPTTTAAPTTTTEAPEVPANMEAALIKLEDLPSGYAASPPDEDDGEDAPEPPTDPAGCDDDTEDLTENASARANFQKSTFGPFITHSITKADKKALREAFEQFKGRLEACASFTQPDSTGATITYTFTPMSMKKFGDETFAANMKLSGGMFPAEANFVIVRKGSYLNVIASVGIGAAPGDVDLEKLMEASMKRL